MKSILLMERKKFPKSREIVSQNILRMCDSGQENDKHNPQDIVVARLCPCLIDFVPKTHNQHDFIKDLVRYF